MTSIQLKSILNFVQLIFRSNGLVSGLNTNAIVYIDNNIEVVSTKYLKKTSSAFDDRYGSSCAYENPTAPAGFYSVSALDSAYYHQSWPETPLYFEPNASAMVDGFFGGCTSLDALLASTLDCLDNIECLEILLDYFPILNNVCIISFNIFL